MPLCRQRCEPASELRRRLPSRFANSVETRAHGTSHVVPVVICPIAGILQHVSRVVAEVPNTMAGIVDEARENAAGFVREWPALAAKLIGLGLYSAGRSTSRTRSTIALLRRRHGERV